MFVGISLGDGYGDLPRNEDIEFFAIIELPQNVQLTKTGLDSTETPFELWYISNSALDQGKKKLSFSNIRSNFTKTRFNGKNCDFTQMHDFLLKLANIWYNAKQFLFYG